MATLSIKGVRKSFGVVEVLNNIDIELEDGGFLVLLGPSGCGKSTLLSIIAGLEPSSGGDVVIGERNVNNVHPKDRNIAMVFQSYALYPTMSVKRNIGFGLEMRKVPEAEREAGVQAGGGAAADRASARAQARAALGRPAPARRHGPRHRARPGPVPVRRAAQQPRCQAARRDAHRDQAPARPAGHHHRLRHARPDRGDDAGHQGGGDEERRDPAARRPADHLRASRPTCSSPASSARRR